MIYHMKAVPICGTVFEEEGWMSCCSVVISGWISRRDLCFAALDAIPGMVVSLVEDCCQSIHIPVTSVTRDPM